MFWSTSKYNASQRKEELFIWMRKSINQIFSICILTILKVRKD